jgi:endonuclease/exonuclease/phosphatase family metal-dependent hydrolase
VAYRVMSFNIRWDGLDHGTPNIWEKRKLQVVTLLKKYSPDIISLQEASPAQTRFIKDALGEYGVFVPPHERAVYHAILFRAARFALVDRGSFWLVERSDLAGGTRRCAWVRLSDVGADREFYVYNVHLDGRSEVSRQLSVVKLMEAIGNRRPQAPFLVTGDFNDIETSRSISYLKGEIPLADEKGRLHLNMLSLRDAVREASPNRSANLGTAHGFTGDVQGPRIDYVFASSGIRIRNANIVHDSTGGHFPSDHFPVIADVQLAN